MTVLLGVLYERCEECLYVLSKRECDFCMRVRVYSIIEIVPQGYEATREICEYLKLRYII